MIPNYDYQIEKKYHSENFDPSYDKEELDDEEEMLEREPMIVSDIIVPVMKV